MINNLTLYHSLTLYVSLDRKSIFSIRFFYIIVATSNGISGNGIPYFGGMSVETSSGSSNGMYSTGKYFYCIATQAEKTDTDKEYPDKCK